jgi:tetratricopeptide (TPR) repeat protein
MRLRLVDSLWRTPRVRHFYFECGATGREGEARQMNLDPPIFVQLADAYRKEGLLADAIRICRDGLDAHPSCVKGRIILAKALFEEGAFDLARGECEQILTAEPDQPEAVQLLAAMSAGQQPGRQSGECKDDPLASPTLAALYAAQGHTRAAAAIYLQLGMEPGAEAGKRPNQDILNELVALREGARRLRMEGPGQP